MNWKYILLSIFSLTLSQFPCNGQTADLEKFESVLGPEKSKVLTQLVEDFENRFLPTYYPNSNLTEGYLAFMEQMAKRNFPKREELILKENEKKYRDSRLINEKYLFIDSVWLDKKGIKSVWTFTDSSGENHTEESFRPLNKDEYQVKDSILEIEKKIFRFNSYSDYTKALEAVKDESPFIATYFTLVTQFGLVGSSVLFPIIKEDNLDINGPVERRVLVLDMIY